jgi:ATP phosphoribosyltransferase
LRSFGIEADVVRLDGAVESSVRLGVADAVADVVSTGTTLKAAGLEVFGEPLLKSEAILVRANSVPETYVSVLAARLRGVLMARQYVLMDYDVPAYKLEEAITITPGFEAPTVTPLHGSEWQAVRVMVPRTEMNHVMDALYAAGARAILTTELLAVRI